MILSSQKLSRIAALLLLAAAARAETPSQRGYHLFRPVPKDRMRPLAADRPDATESPQTVDAGHVQLEVDIAAYLRDRGGSYEDTFAFATTNVKFGLAHYVDLQLVWGPYVRTKTRVNGMSDTDEGFSNLVLRTKVNLWGNDGNTKTAFALLPFVSIPVGDSQGPDDVEGGLVLPFATELPRGWGFGAQIGFDYVRNAADTGHEWVFTQAVVFGHDIAGGLAGFVEFASAAPEDGNWTGTVDLGLTYAVNDNVQLDAAVFIGVNRDAPDYLVFAGITWRF